LGTRRALVVPKRRVPLRFVQSKIVDGRGGRFLRHSCRRDKRDTARGVERSDRLKIWRKPSAGQPTNRIAAGEDRKRQVEANHLVPDSLLSAATALVGQSLHPGSQVNLKK